MYVFMYKLVDWIFFLILDVPSPFSNYIAGTTWLVVYISNSSRVYDALSELSGCLWKSMYSLGSHAIEPVVENASIRWSLTTFS